jgi:hypothetical protein
VTAISEGQWNLLRQRAPRGGAITVSETAVTVPGGPVLFGIDERGHRHLLVPVTGAVLEDSESRGVQIGTRKLSASQGTTTYADMVCLRPNLAAEFGHIVSDVLDALSGGAAPAAVCHNSLEKWRDLLRGAGARGFDDGTAVGLFGELFTLGRMAVVSPSALVAWTGPEGGRFDFMGHDVAIEVKTSTRRYGRLVEVSGETQLDAPPGVALHLLFLRVEKIPAGGETLGGMLDGLQSTGISAVEIERRLALLGLDASLVKADVRCFRVLETRLYAVDGAFPKIVPASFAAGHVPPGVFHLRYVIDLSAEPPLPIPDAGADAIFKRLAGSFSNASET